MKNKIKLTLLALTLITAFGCGVQNTTKKGSSSQSALIAKSGAQVVTGQTAFTGDWFGYVDGSQMIMKIGSNGVVQFTAGGVSLDEKLVMKNNEYFVTNSGSNGLSPIAKSNGGLLLTADGEGFYFFPMGQNQQY